MFHKHGPIPGSATMNEFLRVMMGWMEAHGFDCFQWSEYSIQCKHCKLKDENGYIKIKLQ